MRAITVKMYISSVIYAVVFIMMCFLFREADLQSTDLFDVTRECNYTTQCDAIFGFSDCKNQKCECRNGFYFARDLNNDRKCRICPSFGERCNAANCCRYSEYLACIDGFCRCRDASMDSCLNFEPTTELVIAAKLALFGIILVSLAILLMVLRRSCGGDEFDPPGTGYRRDRIYASLNSIQRFVLAKMQDRPPPYDELEPSTKPPPYSVALSTQDCYGCEAPPPYSYTMFAQSTSSNEFPGVSNPAFTTTEPLDSNSARILPITLTSSTPGPSFYQITEANQTDDSDLKRPVLTDPAVRRMSNYSTFATQPETENPLSTSGLVLDTGFQAVQTDPRAQPNSLACGPEMFSGAGPGPSLISGSEFGVDPVSGSRSSETLVDWSGKEVQTTDLPFCEPGSSDDWLSATLSPVVQPGPSGVRGPSEQVPSEVLKNLGSLPTFFISKRRGSQSSAVSDGSEVDSMSLAREYYSYNDDDACCLVSHLHPAAHPPDRSVETNQGTS